MFSFEVDAKGTNLSGNRDGIHVIEIKKVVSFACAAWIGAYRTEGYQQLKPFTTMYPYTLHYRVHMIPTTVPLYSVYRGALILDSSTSGIQCRTFHLSLVKKQNLDNLDITL